MATQSMEDVLASPKPQQERRLMRPQPDQSLNCPRCDSTNTKFCYYNNYSLSQPRYFCKACRRYWTKGGSLRNVPVGGGCRKNKRSSSSSKKSTTSTQGLPNNTSNSVISSFPPFLTYDPNDLTLAFDGLHKQSTKLYLGLGHDHPDNSMLMGNSTTEGPTGFLDSFRSSSHEGPSNLHSFYRGFGVDQMGEMENDDGGDNCEEDMVMPYDEMGGATEEPTKQQFNYDGKDGENRNVFWNLPWQLGGEGNNMGSVDSGRDHQCWNDGLVGSSWHGLVNGSLM